jgi:hypothetical protein
MKTPKVTNDSSKASGTCFIGYLPTTYDTLREKLGEPLTGYSGDEKVTCEWIIEFENGSVGTIYDWKTNATPLNEYNWHVGGRGINTLDKVGRFVGLDTRQTLFA